MRVAESASIASRIELAFQSASTSTGTSFDYLVKTAQRESSLNPAAKARTSSATGLFQFIESTWLETMKEAGSRHGLEKYSDHIQRGRSGKFYVKDPQMRREILDLRKDPEISSMMAGALTQKNSNYLESKLGRKPSDGELYMAHFLGAHGASKLIDAAASSPDMRADKLFSRQARANKPIFYNRNGSARSMEEVYQVIVSKHDAVTMIAQAGGKKNLRTSGELLNVATLPNSKPVILPQMIAQEGFDHLAGDPAAAFAMRSKPEPPLQTASVNPHPEMLVSNAEAEKTARTASLAAETVALKAPTKERFDQAFAAPSRARFDQAFAAIASTTGSPNFTTASLPVPETKAASVDQPRREPVLPPANAGSLDGLDEATERVLTAFQASETGNPFEALFRNDQGSNNAGVNPRFTSAFAAVSENRYYSSASTQVAAQQMAVFNGRGPLDLTRFLRLEEDQEPKDLLPPA
jgi:hypothetical protein